MTTDATQDRIVGCLLGGAIGDALGAGIEFSTLAEIRHQHGPAGISSYVPAYGRTGAITDDTQMTLFTTEGLIRAWVRGRSRGICHPPSVVRNAYLRWLATQGHPLHPDATMGGTSWLYDMPELHSLRAPGNTCLSALIAGGDGAPDRPINNSMGCGGVMRAAPVGFLAVTAERRFGLGCEIAALTHGHPNGYLPAGCLAVAVGSLIDGASMREALDAAEAELAQADCESETVAAFRAGRTLGADGVPSPEAIERLGGGWVGHEALAIAVACVASSPDFVTGVLAAVNHSGDSDSTGSIAGNLLGAAGGAGVLPVKWLDGLELREVIETLGHDAWLEFRGGAPSNEWGDVTDEWFERYPGC